MKSRQIAYNVLFANVFRYAVFIAAIGAVGCSPESSEAKTSAPTMHLQNEEGLAKIVSDYVQRTRKWPEGDYTVQFNSRDGKTLIFWVLYKGDDFRKPGGGGQSFEAFVNSDTKKVEKELQFQ